jgi:beta-galactosidase
VSTSKKMKAFTARRHSATSWLAIIAFMALFYFPANGAPLGRTTLSLDGQWQIADSKLPDEMPVNYTRAVPVPGLANLSKPAFPDVDKFISREHLAKLISEKKAPADWITNYPNGKAEQGRNYFWYRKTFRAPNARAVAMLKISKAQFGTEVWLNGQQLTPQDDSLRGEYPGCFTASFWNLSKVIHWNAENTLVIRVGAHPGVLPADFPAGADFEKIKWTPGIYDEVSAFFFDNPEIEAIQVASRIATGEIEVQATIKNYSNTPAAASLYYTIKPWKGGEQVATTKPETISLRPGENKIFTQTIKIPAAHLWSPEDPFLYVLEANTGGDSIQARFGMREFRFDAATGRAYLNGKAYYLRGSNITLHRFFEDPLCGDLPWNDAWVRKLLGGIPKHMHWNYFRFCIGPVPDRWFEICDEAGLLVQNEFPVWTGGANWYKSEGYSRNYDADEMIRQYKDWMRDNWNHPSVAVWDANNETQNPIFGEKVIPAVRGLDLSNRSWENSYNKPAGPDDMEEYHAYFEHSGYRGKLTFKMSDLETADGKPAKQASPSTNNPVVLNEYGWLWLNRDGTPTELSRNVYAQIMGTNVTARQRLDRWAYLLAGETEFWRAHRQLAGICHFVYLTCSYPGVYTSDNWSDVRHLKLDPAFADYMGEAFKPLGVYINFFHPKIETGRSHEFLVKMVNDYDKPIAGQLVLTLETKNGKVLAKTGKPFALAALGAGDFFFTLPVPDKPQNNLVLKATATPDHRERIGQTISRRWLSVVH